MLAMHIQRMRVCRRGATIRRVTGIQRCHDLVHDSVMARRRTATYTLPAWVYIPIARNSAALTGSPSMPTLRPAVQLVLERRLDVFAFDTGSPLLRAAAYRRGAQWRDWHTIPSMPAFAYGPHAPAVCGSADGRIVHVAARAAEVLGDTGIFHARSSNYLSTWDIPWREIGNGRFTSTTTLACSGDGQLLYAFARGTDNRCWYARSVNAGTSWEMAWQAIGSGVFETSCSAAVTADGETVIVVGRGTDDRCWMARSRNRGQQWELAWAAIGAGTLSSAPAVAMSADGGVLYVLGRGMDNMCWWNRSTDLGQSWRGWAKIPSGVFLTGPAAATSWDGEELYVVSAGTDKRMWWGASFNRGEDWPVAWAPVQTRTFD